VSIYFTDIKKNQKKPTKHLLLLQKKILVQYLYILIKRSFYWFIKIGITMSINKNNKLKSLVIGAVSMGFSVYTGLATAGVIGGVFTTDRFGYSGTVVKYKTLKDAQSGIDATETILINDTLHRDASFDFKNNASSYGNDINVLMGSWWYTINGSAGHGNTDGNTGVGYMQMYDADSSTDSSIEMNFSNFDGSYWTDFNLMVSGGSATSVDDYARFSAYDNVHDAGTYLSYNLDITATGLMGIQTGNIIEANNHATGVSGSFNALFSFGGDSQGDIYDGFYSISLDFDMDNWAYSNNGNLNGDYHNNGDIYASQFITISSVPEPTTLAIFGLGLLALVSRKIKIS